MNTTTTTTPRSEDRPEYAIIDEVLEFTGHQLIYTRHLRSGPIEKRIPVTYELFPERTFPAEFTGWVYGLYQETTTISGHNPILQQLTHIHIEGIGPHQDEALVRLYFGRNQGLAGKYLHQILNGTWRLSHRDDQGTHWTNYAVIEPITDGLRGAYLTLKLLFPADV